MAAGAAALEDVAGLWFVVVLMVGRCCYGCFGCDGACAALAAALLLAAELAGVTGLALAGCTLVLVHSLGSDVGLAKRNCFWRSGLMACQRICCRVWMSRRVSATLGLVCRCRAWGAKSDGSSMLPSAISICSCPIAIGLSAAMLTLPDVKLCLLCTPDG